MNQNKISLAFLVTWIVTMAAGTVLMFTGSTHESLWFDESYSAAIVNHSIPEIISITGGDSHPPLYYLLLHIFTQIFGTSVLALRAFSVLGVIALAALSIGPVRRALGNRFGLIYTLITFTLPISLSIGQEVRMYTWAAFFVTGSALYGYLGYKEGHLKDWIIFGVCTLAAAYTHYYALLAVAIICAMLFVTMLIEKIKIVPLLCTAGAAAVCYIPWIFRLAAQASRVGANFWIPPVTGQVIKNVLVYPFSNKFSWPLPKLQVLLDIALFISAALILFGIIYRIIRRDESVKMTILAVGTFILTIGAGIAASFIIRPFLVERYIVPVLGLFVLGLSYGIGSLSKKIFPIIGCAIIIALSVPSTNFTMSNRFNGPMTRIVDFLGPRVQPGDVFVHIDEHTLGTFCYYFPDHMNYYYQREGYGGYSNYEAFKPNGLMLDSLDELGENKHVWLVQRLGAPDNVTAKEWLRGELKQIGTQKDFTIKTSWYKITIYETTLGSESE